MTEYDLVSVKREGGVVNPDDIDWRCDCPVCAGKRDKQLKAYEKYLREVEND